MKKLLVGLIICIVIWATMLVQVNLLSTITLFGTKACIGIVLITGIGLMCDKTPGSIIGFIFGLLQDILFGKAIGVYALLYMLLGYVTGRLGKGFSKDNKTTLIVMVGISTIVFDILFQILAMIIYKYDLSIINFVSVVLKEAIYNILLVIILFKPLLLLSEIINKSKNSYYLL